MPKNLYWISPLKDKVAHNLGEAYVRVIVDREIVPLLNDAPGVNRVTRLHENSYMNDFYVMLDPRYDTPEEALKEFSDFIADHHKPVGPMDAFEDVNL